MSPAGQGPTGDRREARARLLWAAVLFGTWGLAWVLRLRDLDATVMLWDSVGPWLRALRSPVEAHAHAPPYGWALHPPYALCLLAAGSLRQAVALWMGVHALAAPLAAAGAGRLAGVGGVPGLPAALCAGLLVALDPGLVDGVRSGSDGYLAPVWVGLLAWCVVARGRWCWLAGPAFAAAVMNHPLALCAAPLLALLPLDRRSLAGLALGGLALAPHVGGLWGQEITGTTGGQPTGALSALLVLGGPATALLLAAPLLALVASVWAGRDSATSGAGSSPRAMALACVACAVLFGLAGQHLGYLRDHHLRVLTVPFAACLGGLPWWALALGLFTLRIPASQLPEPNRPPRPGTLGLVTEVRAAVEGLPRPFYVDGAWHSGAIAAEPAAVMLDLHLRGIPVEDIAPDGMVAVILSFERGRAPAVERPLHRGDRYLIVTEDPEDLARQLCGQARLGGAWDALSVFHPELTLPQVSTWRAGCPDP